MKNEKDTYLKVPKSGKKCFVLIVAHVVVVVVVVIAVVVLLLLFFVVFCCFLLYSYLPKTGLSCLET